MLSLSEKKFQEIIAALPKRDRGKLSRKALTVEELEERILASESAMKRDLWVGIPWFVMYTTSLMVFGFQGGTVALLLIGAAYFVYSFIKFGSFGLNRIRVKVFKQLIQEVT